MKRSTGTTTAAMLCQQGGRAPPWDEIAEAVAVEEESQINFYRDANAWCPFCHRVWFVLEQKKLKFRTRTVHLRGDPREPTVADWYLELVPSGVVPALELDGVLITESKDIVYALERAFPTSGITKEIEAVFDAAPRYDCDNDEWLRNTDPKREEALKKEAMAKIGEIEAMLSNGYFASTDEPTVGDAAMVGFLTRTQLNYKFFKGLDITEHPNIGRWFELMASQRGFKRTRQEAFFEQRIYQAHPARRGDAERCMGLRPSKFGVGESAEYKAPPLERSAVANIEAEDASEAARILCARRKPLIRFLRRKLAERRTANQTARRDDRGKLFFETVPSQEDEDDDGIRSLAALLASLGTGKFFAPMAGDFGVDAAAAAAGGAMVLSCTDSLIAALPALIGTPRDMPVGAARAVRGCVRAMQCAAGALNPTCTNCGRQTPAPLAVEIGILHCAECRTEPGDEDEAPMEVIVFE